MVKHEVSDMAALFSIISPMRIGKPCFQVRGPVRFSSIIQNRYHTRLALVAASPNNCGSSQTYLLPAISESDGAHQNRSHIVPRTHSLGVFAANHFTGPDSKSSGCES